MNELMTLSQTLKAAQRELIVNAARTGRLPPDGVIRKIAELESAIIAVDTLIGESEGGKDDHAG
ncbi:hypothetical protein [uncultured Alsobacter sp.]|uniref:hypothetical protein n=1 Tax=uncultured Alsobacter sp. TaxID=1748258 RepID=UPI0025CFF4D0|nr:hypothetical protein [uncultured Alsobacter sp.]